MHLDRAPGCERGTRTEVRDPAQELASIADDARDDGVHAIGGHQDRIAVEVRGRKPDRAPAMMPVDDGALDLVHAQHHRGRRRDVALAQRFADQRRADAMSVGDDGTDLLDVEPARRAELAQARHRPRATGSELEVGAGDHELRGEPAHQHLVDPLLGGLRRIGGIETRHHDVVGAGAAEQLAAPRGGRDRHRRAPGREQGERMGIERDRDDVEPSSIGVRARPSEERTVPGMHAIVVAGHHCRRSISHGQTLAGVGPGRRTRAGEGEERREKSGGRSAEPLPQAPSPACGRCGRGLG